MAVLGAIAGNGLMAGWACRGPAIGGFARRLKLEGPGAIDGDCRPGAKGTDVANPEVLGVSVKACGF